MIYVLWYQGAELLKNTSNWQKHQKPENFKAVANVQPLFQKRLCLLQVPNPPHNNMVVSLLCFNVGMVRCDFQPQFPPNLIVNKDES